MNTHWTIGLFTIIICRHLAASAPDTHIFCPDVPNLPPDQIPLVKFPQDFTTTIEINHFKNTQIPKLVDSTVMMKAVRGEKRGVIQEQETNNTHTVLYDFERKQMIDIEQSENGYFCGADRLTEGDGWIIRDHSSGHHVPVFGTSEWILRYDPYNATVLYLGQESIRGIPVNTWRVCHESEKTGIVTIKHYWSDPFQWTPLIGINRSDLQNLPYEVPVAMEIKIKKNKEEYHQIFSFFTYDVAPADETQFDIPDGIYCDSIYSEVRVSKLPDYYSFDSEIVIKATPGDVVTNQQHLYDGKLNLTRVDFSLALDNSGEQTKVFKFTYIEDFKRMISFLINKRDGTCEIERISEHSRSKIDNWELLIADPHTALRKGVDLQMMTYYKQSADRGIEADVFKGLFYRGKKLVIQEWWYTSLFETVEESTTTESRVPMKVLEYSLKDAFSNRVEWNIFNFDKSEPDIFLYDVTPCFHRDGRQHFKFNLNRDYDDLNPNGETQLRYTIFTKLIQWSMLHPLRISNVQLDGVWNETVVLFTILGKPNVKEAIEELDTEFVVEVLQMIFDSNMANVPYKDEKGNEVILQAVPNSFEEIDREEHCWKLSKPTTEPNTSTQDPSALCQDQNTTGHSDGSMAGLAIGTLFIGSTIGGIGALLYFIKFKP